MKNRERLARAAAVISARERKAARATISATQRVENEILRTQREAAEALPTETRKTLRYLEEHDFPWCQMVTIKEVYGIWSGKLKRTDTEPGWALDGTSSTAELDSHQGSGGTTVFLMASGDYLVRSTHSAPYTGTSTRYNRSEAEQLPRQPLFQGMDIRQVLDQVVSLRSAE
jgi:hypothetical protein